MTSSKTFLLTRPYNDNLELEAELKAQGHNVIIEPLFQVEYKQVMTVPACTVVIFTSKNALTSVQNIANKLTHCDCYVVGNACAELAKSMGFKYIYIADNSAYSLLDLLIDNIDKRFDRMVYFCGEITSLDITSILHSKGYEIEEEIVYKTIATNDFSLELKQKIVANAIDVVLLYSYHTAEIFLELLCKNKLEDCMQRVEARIISNKLRSLLEVHKWKNIVLL